MVGRKVKRLRKQLQLSQEELAQKTLIPQSQLCRIEKGVMTPSLSDLIQLSRSLSVNVDYFYK
ncbi:helix-turn-helix domain-containing protein [Sediminitomix flava]|uniref:Helix-turn-helix protein n=1 Tax=Sediminitomix flava TaxID=379075 RepID=A0A315ZFZ0_SEDFL|nr:helix-turn-helix protein [Sediminitomix flava]